MPRVLLPSSRQQLLEQLLDISPPIAAVNEQSNDTEKKQAVQKREPLPSQGEFDVLIIGGGATGAAVAIDAQQRGLRTLLVERGDFSSGNTLYRTSAWATSCAMQLSLFVVSSPS